MRILRAVDLREHEEKILLVLAMVIAATVGLTVVAFVAITERLGNVLSTVGTWQRIASPLMGSLVGGWLLFRFFPEARGSGIPQTRVALLLLKGRIGMRTVVGKFVCSSISLGSGVALGREGPSVHIGAGIASVIARRLGLGEQHVRSLIPVGTAAAVAAAFNTPLAAVLFTLEEILADLHARVVGSVVIGAATSWIVLRLILGDEPLFHVPAYQLVHPVEFLVYALLGLVGGLVSTGFVKLLLWERAKFLRVPVKWRAVAPAAGGLVVGLLAIAHPGVLGAGYHFVSDALNGRLALSVMLLLLFLKLIATTSSYSSGNAGGVFGPSLFIGAMLGGVVGQVAHTAMPNYTGNAGAYALVGMGAAFAGIVRTPMTSVIMIFEVTRDYTIIVPLMIANLCSYLLASRLQRIPLYEALSLQEGIHMPSASHLPEPLTVDQAMQPCDGDLPPTPITYPDEPLDAALQRMAEAQQDRILVVSRTRGEPLGMVRSQGVLDAYQRSGETKREAAAGVQDWVPVVAAITIAAVLIVSGLVFWQRSRRAGIGGEAYESGAKLLAQGQTEEAVLAFRNALAQTPADPKIRAALGLALVETNHYEEARSYLAGVAKAQPDNGALWAAMAKIALAGGDRAGALRMYRQALQKDWSADAEPERRRAQLRYADLLVAAGQKAEAVAALMALIQESGNDAGIGKQAAEKIAAAGSLEQTEAAYRALANHFPADPAVWMKLGDTQFAAGRDAQALDSYRAAAKVTAGSEEAQKAASIVEEVLRIDPTQRRLSLRERTQRWGLVLQRMLQSSAECLIAEQKDRAGALLKQRPATLEAMDRVQDTAKELWNSVDESCRRDPVLAHIMAKLAQ